MRIFTLSVLIFSLFFSCKPEPKRNYQNSDKSESTLRMSFLLSGNTITLGDSVQINLSSTDSSLNVNQARIEAGGEIFPVENGKAIITTHHLKAGRNILSAILKTEDREIRKSLTLIVRSNKTPTQFGFKIISTLPHDPQAYTQGFVWHEGSFYEGTGLEKKSSLREANEKTGEVKRSISLAPEYFGEGVAIYKDRIYQLTWKNRKGFVYDLKSFELLKEFSYATEGWGLATMDSVLVMSDGSEILYLLDPEGLNIISTLEVYTDEGPVRKLNELEFIEGQIWANVYGQDILVLIDPKTGIVEGMMDAADLLNRKQKAGADVFNGIAYDSIGNRIFVTGKLWPSVFQIELKQRPQL